MAQVGFFGGGGVSNDNAGTINIVNSTISGNSALPDPNFQSVIYGGGIRNSDSGRVYVTNSTIADNKGGQGARIYMADSFVAPVTLKNTIVSNNIGGNCNSYVTDGGNNLQYPGTTCSNTISSAGSKLGSQVIAGTPAILFPLLPGSPAINAGNNTVCAAAPISGVDQRGVIRPQGANCDIGAVEMNILTVNSIADTDDASCDTIGNGTGNKDCTLREAINAANISLGSFIYFNISGNGVKTISPASALPSLTKPVVIDGTTQSGASCGTSPANATLLIEINGTNAGQNSSGLTFSGGTSTIRGLVINHFGSNGINFNTKDNNLLECNFIGTNAAGNTAAVNGGDGILINGSSNNILGQANVVGSWNLISGNNGVGIRVISGKSNIAASNWVGSNSSGTATIRNQGGGIKILTGGQLALSSGNKVKN